MTDRDRPDFMTKSDDPLLEHIREHGVGTPAKAAEAVGIHHVHAGRRLRALRDHGFVCRYVDGVYLLTEKGRAYLAGELDDATDGDEDS